MHSTAVNGVSMGYEVCEGASEALGESLVLSHCSVVAYAFAPQMD